MNNKQCLKIIINIGTHGDEQIGFYVANKLKKLVVKKGQLIFNIGNEKNSGPITTHSAYSNSSPLNIYNQIFQSRIEYTSHQSNKNIPKIL